MTEEQIAEMEASKRRRNSQPGKKGFLSRPLSDRFWERVTRLGDDECWLWIGAKHPSGYGLITVEGRNKRATHVAWEIANAKPFPTGMFACHSCDNPSCVNPKHLWPGTHRQNMADALAKGRLGLKPKDKCARGHEMVPENTYRVSSGGRGCRLCKKAAMRELYLAKKRSALRIGLREAAAKG